MTTMIRKCRIFVAVSLLTAVIMSFPIATTSEAMIQRETATRPHFAEDLPDRLATERMACEAAHPLRRCALRSERTKGLYIAWRESRFRPSAYNATGDAAGIYQHLLRYWPHRSADFGFRNWSAFNARANIFVTMRMVLRYGWDPWGG